MIRDDMKRLFKNFETSIVKQSAIMIGNIENTKGRFLGKYSQQEIENELNALEKEGFIIYRNTMVSITDKGKSFFLS